MPLQGKNLPKATTFGSIHQALVWHSETHATYTMENAEKLNSKFYDRDDVVQISRELLGKVLCTDLPGGITRAIITETEAYAGVGDKASHAYGGRRTKRTEPMFGEGGIAYV